MTKLIQYIYIMLFTLSLLTCGLPTQIFVAAPQVVNRAGTVVVFEIGETNGFVLYYQVYPPDEDPSQNIDLTQSGFSREEDIFRYFGYIKSYPSFANSIIRPRFIWQPSSDHVAPYTVTLDTITGDIQIRDYTNREVLNDRLIRYNLQDFRNFRRGDEDLRENYSSNTGQLTWAAMNMKLDLQTITVQLSVPMFLHYANITIG